MSTMINWEVARGRADELRTAGWLNYLNLKLLGRRALCKRIAVVRPLGPAAYGRQRQRADIRWTEQVLYGAEVVLNHELVVIEVPVRIVARSRCISSTHFSMRFLAVSTMGRIIGFALPVEVL